MQFDPFVIPFNIGLYFILIYVVVRSVIWFRDLSQPDKLRLQRGFFGGAFAQSIKEIFLESLIHRKILKTNLRLGYMHMSLAFGWFLLILFGTIEADIFGAKHLNAPYKAIFFRFFNPDHGRMGFEAAYGFFMDLILAFILSGLILAVVKRFYSKVVGLKKTTRLRYTDKIALAALWLIFPSRLLAESFTSAVYHSGHFLTGSLGEVLATFLPVHHLMYPAWWAYSLSLGVFFIALPFSRYMHIPTEMLLIFLKNYGIKTEKEYNSFSEIEVNACPRCGICIDQCQLNVAQKGSSSAVYFLQALRNKGIPYKLGGARGLYFREEIRNLIAFLRILVDYSDEISMYRLISMSIWGLTPREYIEINKRARTNNVTLFEQNEWNVEISGCSYPYSISKSTLSCISCAAFSVKVRANISEGFAHSSLIMLIILCVKTAVLPVPAPAIIRRSPSLYSTACFWF